MFKLVAGAIQCVTVVLVFFSFTDNLGVYLNKNKAVPSMIHVFNCLSGDTESVDVNVLAAQ